MSAHRFKRALLGYRRAEVDEAFAARGAEVDASAAEAATQARRADELEEVGRRLAASLVRRERELGELRAELARERKRGDEVVDALAVAAVEIEGVRRQARAQATRIRVTALRQAGEVSQRIASMRPEPGRASERLVEALAAAVERVGVEVEEADGGGRPDARPEDLFEGLVEVEIGPLADFSQLVGFEDAARSIAATSELSIKRFSAGRATLAMSIKEPVELLRELEDRCDLEFRVRDRRPNRLVLDVD